MDTNDKGAALSAEQDADLRRLEMMAQGDEPAPAESVANSGETPAVDPVEEAEAMFSLVVATVSGFVPGVEDLYPPERIRKMAVAYVPLAQKRGWDALGWLEKYGLEVAFISACIPPQVWARVIELVKAWWMKRRGETQQKTGDEPAAPAVTIGAAPKPDAPTVPAVTIGEPVPA